MLRRNWPIWSVQPNFLKLWSRACRAQLLFLSSRAGEGRGQGLVRNTWNGTRRRRNKRRRRAHADRRLNSAELHFRVWHHGGTWLPFRRARPLCTTTGVLGFYPSPSLFLSLSISLSFSLSRFLSDKILLSTKLETEGVRAARHAGATTSDR